MMNQFLATAASGQGVMDAMLESWSDPALRPALFAAAMLGLILGCLLIPLGRRVWLAIKPRSTTRTRD